MHTPQILKIGLISLGCLTIALPAHSQEFKAKTYTSLKSDGVDKGSNAYKLIRKAFGKKALESPDLYDSNHTDTAHIIEDEDAVIGPHFVFLAHRDSDSDRDKGKTDRQRNEIKIYDRSHDSQKGFQGETLQYRWKFKIDESFEFSKSFTHFFQIKPKNVSKENKKNGGDKFPLITFTAVDKGGDKGNEFQVRYSPGIGKDGSKASATKLIREDMAGFTGQWIEFFVQIQYGESGNLTVIAKNIETGERLIGFKKDDLDMWRGEGEGDFNRPKWGIYRSLKDHASLREEEERARFADFIIAKGAVE